MGCKKGEKAKHGSYNRGAGRVAVGAFAFALVVVAALCVAVLALRPPSAVGAAEALGFELPVLPISPEQTQTDASAGERAGGRADSSGFQGLGDKEASEEEVAAYAEEARRTRQTPLVACCSGVDLRCPVVLPEVTGIMFHQASYDYALPLETELPEADYETAASTRTIRVNGEQDAGPDDWADAEVLHLWRTTDATEMDTSIDLGALPGTDVRSPVTGTVVLVRDYLLYDEMPDIEIHIQPEGRPDLDCVLIHLTDASVRAGDRVQAGITPIAKVRNIEEFLTDVQLGFFTPEGVGGNHTHVQVNNADYAGYRESKLEGAATA